MTEEQTFTDTINNFAKALVNKDKDKAISFFSEDSFWVTPNGTFSGLDGISNYIEWMNNNIDNQEITESGKGILVKDKTGIYQHVISGMSKGRNWHALAICIYEFEGEKIKGITMVYDRLSVAHQVTTGIAKTAVGNVVREMEKGLR